MANIEERYFYGKDGSKIFFRSSVPENPIATVIILHGYAEHSGRYIHVMDYLTSRNFAVFAPDERGHGKTARVMGDLEGFDRIIDDTDILVKQAAEKYPTRGVFMLGHSMGGMIALLYTEKYQEKLKGLILSGPMLVLSEQPSGFLRLLSKVMGKLLPRLPVKSFDSSYVSRDNEVVKRKDEDPLYYKGKVMARAGYWFLKGIDEAIADLGRIEIPVLVMHGGGDRIIDPEASKIVYHNVSSEDKTLKIFDGLYHEIMNEPEKDEVLKMIGDWIEKRV